jgi:hypothetical protein
MYCGRVFEKSVIYDCDEAMFADFPNTPREKERGCAFLLRYSHSKAY